MPPKTIDVQPAEVKTSYTYVRLCTERNMLTLMSCDLEAGHTGPHKATLLWNGDDEDDA
jgi:hypothetical protein